LFEDPLEVVVVPPGPEAFVFDSDRQAVLLFEEVDCSRRLSARRRSPVLGGMTRADAALVLPEDHVQNPVHLVFNVPMSARRLQKLLRIGLQAAQK